MKKKVLSVVATAMVLMASLPGVAMAAQFNSPSGTTVTAPNTNVALSVSGDVTSASGSGYISVEPDSTVASNVPAGVTPLASFEVVAEGDVEFTKLTLTFSVGAQYAGAKATVYITHSDGTSEVVETTVASDGTVTLDVDRLSVFSIVVDESTVSADGASTGSTSAAGTTGTVKDTSATSPATGVVILPIAGVTAAAAAGAAAVAVELRKKISK